MTAQIPTSTTYIEPLEREGSALTVLAVGIDDESRDSILDSLGARDLTVEAVQEASTADALARIESDDVDCVVSHNTLPEATGLEFLGDVREHHGDIPFVLVTQAGSESLAAEAVNTGVDGYVSDDADVSDDATGEQYARVAEQIETAVDEYRTRNRLSETTRLLSRLTEYTNDAFWMFTGDWNETVVVNSAYEDVWDRPLDDIVTDPDDFLEGVHPEDREMLTDGMELLSSGEPADVEYRATTDDGVRWLSVHAEPVFDVADDIEYVAGFTRDITELKNRELSMQSLNSASTELLEARNAGAVAEIVVDIAESVVGCPLAIVRIADQAREELEARAVTDAALDLYERDDVSEIEPIAPGNPGYDFFEAGETRFIDDATVLEELLPPSMQVGSLIIVPLGEHGLLNVGTEPGDTLGEFDRHLLEILSQTATAALNRVERDEELDAYREQLEQSNENLQQFAHTASHDLQEPLRMVSSYVDLLDAEYGDQLDGEAEQYMEFAVDGAHRMQDMIDALLQYARVQTRAQEFEETDPNQVLDDTLASLRLQIDETDSAVSMGSLPAVQADPDQLGQVFQNLIKNAITYADESGVDPRLEIDAAADDGVVTFTVSDNGPGIDEADWQDIFEIFKRNGSHDAEGTGIGLAVCQRIVRRHGGEIWVASDDRDGATFKFTIPVAGTEVSGDD